MSLKLESRDIDTLNPYQNNAKVHSQEQIEQIAASILEFGFNDPLSIDNGNMLVTGHGTHAALKLLVSRGNVEFQNVDCIILDHLSERQKRAYILAHNRIAQNSTWNFEKLSVEMDALINADFDVEMIGFNEQELDSLLKMDRSILPDDLESKPVVNPEPESKEKRSRAKSVLVHKCPECGHEFHA